MHRQSTIWYRFLQFLHCGIYVPLSDDKHQFVRDSSLWALSVWEKIRDKYFLTKLFFPTKKFFLGFFLGLHFVSDCILSWTEFCLGFSLGLHTAVVFLLLWFNCHDWRQYHDQAVEFFSYKSIWLFYRRHTIPKNDPYWRHNCNVFILRHGYCCCPTVINYASCCLFNVSLLLFLNNKRTPIKTKPTKPFTNELDPELLNIRWDDY